MKEYATHEGDTGSPEVQIAVLSRRISDLTERVLFHAEPLSLRLHFLHDLPVVLLQPVLFDDTLQAVGIMPARGIARLFEALCPALVVIGRERETAGIAAVLFQEA